MHLDLQGENRTDLDLPRRLPCRPLQLAEGQGPLAPTPSGRSPSTAAERGEPGDGREMKAGRKDVSPGALSPSSGSRRRRHVKTRSGWDSLTTAELKVVLLVAQGLSNPEVAKRLGISRHTVESHLKHIYRKLDISSRTELTVKAALRV
jgi:DNA-binding CsgD family transcriptional regulator